MEFELVLPCYNESKTLERLIQRVVEVATEFQYTPQRFQLVLVENGSKDNSSEVMDQLKASSLGAWFRKVPVVVNQGYGFGLMEGLKTTSAEFVGFSHADMQCDPKNAFIALSILKQQQSKKVVIKGFRTDRNWKDKMVSRVFESLSFFILGLGIFEINAQPKVFSKELLKEITQPPFTFAFDLYFLFKAKKAGYQIKTIPVTFPPRIHGVSNWASTFLGRYKTILGMVRYMFELVRREGRV